MIPDLDQAWFGGFEARPKQTQCFPNIFEDFEELSAPKQASAVLPARRLRIT